MAARVRWVRICWAVAIAVGLSLGWGKLAIAAPLPLLASIHTYHEQPNQTTYRSRLTLPDRDDRAWQATLFHRFVDGLDQGIYLRLVAFPGSAVVAIDKPLQISTGTGIEWLAHANDATLPASRPDTLGQYAVRDVLGQIQTPIPLSLEVPLAGGRTQQLVVAPYVVEEWLALAGMGGLDSTDSYSPGE